MRLTISQKTDAIAHLKLAGIQANMDLLDKPDRFAVANSVLQLLDLFPTLDTSGQMAIRRIQRTCKEITKKAPS